MAVPPNWKQFYLTPTSPSNVVQVSMWFLFLWRGRWFRDPHTWIAHFTFPAVPLDIPPAQAAGGLFEPQLTLKPILRPCCHTHADLGALPACNQVTDFASEAQRLNACQFDKTWKKTRFDDSMQRFRVLAHVSLPKETPRKW